MLVNLGLAAGQGLSVNCLVLHGLFFIITLIYYNVTFHVCRVIQLLLGGLTGFRSLNFVPVNWVNSHLN